MSFSKPEVPTDNHRQGLTSSEKPAFIFNKVHLPGSHQGGEWSRSMVPLKKGGLIWYTDGSKTNEGTSAGLYAMALVKHSATAWGSMPQYFRPKYMPLRHVLMRILKEAIVI
jgi:hypothetical protein